jgi:hypothetical protein
MRQAKHSNDGTAAFGTDEIKVTSGSPVQMTLVAIEDKSATAPDGNDPSYAISRRSESGKQRERDH